MVRKTLPNLIRAIRLYLFSQTKGKKIESLMHKAEIQGLISSYFLRKSTRRPEINEIYK